MPQLPPQEDTASHNPTTFHNNSNNTCRTIIIQMGGSRSPQRAQCPCPRHRPRWRRPSQTRPGTRRWAWARPASSSGSTWWWWGWSLRTVITTRGSRPRDRDRRRTRPSPRRSMTSTEVLTIPTIQTGPNSSIRIISQSKIWSAVLSEL